MPTKPDPSPSAPLPHHHHVARRIFVVSLFVLAVIAIVGAWEWMSGARSPGFPFSGIASNTNGSAVSVPSMMMFDGLDKVMMADEEYAPEAMMYTRDGGTTIMPPYPSDPPASSGVLGADARKIIRNGSVDLLVSSADTVIDGVSVIAETYGGFVEGSNVYERTEGVKAGYITVRIPSTSFDRAFEDIKSLGVKVVREESSTNDVTAQYVDYEAQLANYRAEEDQYQKIMDRATKIEDVLSVASRLADVRGRIDRIEGQLNLLSRQIGMSTISVSFTAESSVVPTSVIWRPGTVIKESLKNLLEGLANFADFLIRFALYLPVLIIKLIFALIVAVFLWRVGLFTYRKFVLHEPSSS